jgi:hypothetical protein
MNYLILVGGFLLLFASCFLVTGVLGRGWFLWLEDETDGPPRR